jgi:hypothetical protein
VRDRGALGVHAAPPLRAIGSLAVTPEISREVPVVRPIAPTVVTPPPPLPPLAVVTPKVAPVVSAHDAMTLRGEYWEIDYDKHRGVIADCRGLRYIALLVRDTSGGRNPIHAKELTALASGSPSGAIELEKEDVVLDAKAKKELMKRLEEIAFERDRAAAVEDFVRAERLDDEYEQIAEELSRAGATRGRSRKKTAFVHAGEKARKAVAKAIAAAIRRIAVHPELKPLAAHFTATIRKGQWLSYTGSSDWRIELTAPPPRK